MILQLICSAVVASAMLCSSAQAQTQVWQLDTTVYQTTAGAPAQFSAVGEQVVVDYTIDLSASPNSGLPFTDFDAIVGVSVDGVSYPSNGDLAEFSSNFFALNAQSGPFFLSFNNFAATSTTPNLETALAEFSSAVANPPFNGYLRIDLPGGGSTLTRPTSFGIAPAVPESSTVVMMLIGGAMLLVMMQRARCSRMSSDRALRASMASA